MALRTPLYDWHVAHGARMADFAGWDMPIQYSTIIAEHQAVRSGVGLFDISHMGRFVVQGPGATDLVQAVFTNDAAAMKPGQVKYGLVCSESGGILDDVLVYRFEHLWLMVVNASNRERIARWITLHRGSADARLDDRTFDWAMVAVQGPHAVAVVSAVLADRRWKEQWNTSVDRLKYYQALLPGSPNHADAPFFVSRTGYTGEDGIEIILPSARVVALVEDLRAAANRSGQPLKPCGLGARDTLRLEAGMPLYGHELTEEVDPFQAGLAWAVKLSKGEFIGHGALAQRRDDLSLPKRVGLAIEGKRIAREGARVTSVGHDVGRVTSGTFSPTLGKPIAMAYVEPAHAATGTVCSIDVRGSAVPATVVPLPFYRRLKAD